ncbi:MAG: chorismate mutase [Actinomycetes bacterium]|jgi:chorismate mutase
MTARVAALRGATTVEIDTEESIFPRVQEMLAELMERNGLAHDDIISAFFTATPDLTAVFPAAASRAIGFGDIPLICASEIAVRGATAMCVRVMLHAYTTRKRTDIRHVYLHGAQGLRDDLPG